MKCSNPNCKTKIPKESTFCFHCGRYTKFVDIGDASVALIIAWFAGLIALVIVMAIIAGIAESSSDTAGDLAMDFIWPIVIGIWTTFIALTFYFALGPGGSKWLSDSNSPFRRIIDIGYPCPTCLNSNPVPVYQCPRCHQLQPPSGVGNHLIGVFIGFVMISLVTSIAMPDNSNDICLVGMLGGAVFAVILFAQISKFKNSSAEVKGFISSQGFPKDNPHQPSQSAFPFGYQQGGQPQYPPTGYQQRTRSPYPPPPTIPQPPFSSTSSHPPHTSSSYPPPASNAPPPPPPPGPPQDGSEYPEYDKWNSALDSIGPDGEKKQSVYQEWDSEYD